MILITGAAGYIGSHTTAQLVETGRKVVCLDNFYSGHRWAIPKEAVLVEGDIRDSALVRKTIQEHGITS
ncbi:MAG TPA: NAD-dependent epimerase/dehydratase family protein, partial [Bdellovibrionota bacterium]|nr:NAD-dependent epimerase/dehydratase family protein [Bdellovibrionota bacterium]